MKNKIFLFIATFCFTSGFSQSSSTPHESFKEIQQKFFQIHGYLWIKDFFSDEQVSLIQCWAKRINQDSEDILNFTQNEENCTKMLPGSFILVPEANNAFQACRVEDVMSAYPNLFSFISGTVTNYISFLFDEPYVLFKDKLNFKWPGGGSFLPHQDFPAYEFCGPREHVTAMVCIDPATVENGCLYVAKNWRKHFKNHPNIDPVQLKEGKAVLPYITGGKAHGSIQPEYYEDIEWLALTTSPRDLVIFNSFLPHYSEANKSNMSRRAFFLTHNRLKDGEHRKTYFHIKRNDPQNPAFHFATPTKARGKD